MIPSLGNYSPGNFSRGRSLLIEIAWLLIQALFVASWIPGSRHRAGILRVFGAAIGTGVILKPRLRVKFPWRLAIGNNSWVGENVWIDNLGEVIIGNDCCISQGVYICTGSHDWSRPTFDLLVGNIKIESGAWLAARSIVGPGVHIGEGAVLALGAVATTDIAEWTINAGSPAAFVKRRTVQLSNFATKLKD